MRELNASEEYAAVYINVEVVQGLPKQIGPALQGILRELATSVQFYLGDRALAAEIRELAAIEAPGSALSEGFGRLAERSPKPVVLFIDEIDSLIGDTLITALHQIRAGYTKRSTGFPQSIVLCGMRDIKDYRIHASSEKEVITGGSCFNIKAESLRLGDFSVAEMRELYVQRTGAADAHLLIFNRRPEIPWEQKIFRREEGHEALAITVWGM